MFTNDEPSTTTPHHPGAGARNTSDHDGAAVITWRISNDESGAEDSLTRAAVAATTAAAEHLRTHAPITIGWNGPSQDAVTLHVGDTTTALVPCYDQRCLYDHAATTRAGRRLVEQITGDAADVAVTLAESPLRPGA